VAVTGKDRDVRDDEQSPASQPWHNRTPALVGASVAAIVVIGLLVMAGTFVARQFNQPDQAPINFVPPSFSASATAAVSATPTTTATITSTSPPVTTDIDGPSTTTSSSSNSSTTDLQDPSHTAWTRPYTPSTASGSAPTSTTRGPRFNVTRTASP
jgi:hypothetical protein